MADDSLPQIVVDPSPPEEDMPIPKGDSPIHARPDASQVWRLCCRLRLEMRDGRMKLPDVHRALALTYSDLAITQRQLRKFMEEFVDGSVVVEPAFFIKGLMKSKARLNAVVEAGTIAERMQDLAMKESRNPKLPLSEKMLALERAQRGRERQHHLQEEIGFGAQDAQQRAKPAQMPAAPISVENAVFNFGEAVGGSFAKRARAIDVDPKPTASS